MGAELPGTWVKALSRQRVRMRVRDYKVGWGGRKVERFWEEKHD